MMVKSDNLAMVDDALGEVVLFLAMEIGRGTRAFIATAHCQRCGGTFNYRPRNPPGPKYCEGCVRK